VGPTGGRSHPDGIQDRSPEKAGQDVGYREIHDLVHGKDFMPGYGSEGYRANVRTFIKRIRKKFRGEIPFLLIYHRPTGGAEIVTAVTPLSTLLAVVASFSEDAFPSAYLGQPYWATPVVRIAALVGLLTGWSAERVDCPRQRALLTSSPNFPLLRVTLHCPRCIRSFSARPTLGDGRPAAPRP
jgi:hypothetical protein